MTGSNGCRNLSPIITIEELSSPDILYPYYLEGAFHGIPEGLTSGGFYELIESASSFMTFYTAYYNGELVCVFECRRLPSMEYEVHANWLTESKRKRAIVLDRFLDKDEKMVTFVHPDEAGGHFAFCRRGKLNYMGEHNNMHVFRSASWGG